MNSRMPLYDAEFYSDQASESLASAEVIVPLVLSFVPAKSVCDFGCGVGTWLSAFQRHGVTDIVGLDGSHAAQEKLLIPQAMFQPRDLSKPIDLGRRFDLAVSLEVAEHLPASAAASFVSSLVRAAPAVLFSAAIPGQGGIGHINEQWASYWAELFAVHSYLPFDFIRTAVWDDRRVKWWYQQNTLLYCHADALSMYPALQTMRPAKILSVVHPQAVPGIRGLATSGKEVPLLKLLSVLPRALVRAAAKRMTQGRTD